jgi:hypothetical protein
MSMKEIVRRIDPADLIVEVFSIVVAILLAFALNQWHETLKTQSAVQASLANIADEVRGNQRTLESTMPHHQHLLAALKARYGAGTPRAVGITEFFHSLRELNPGGIRLFGGETLAWDIAKNSPAFTSVPYALRVVLERTYREQEHVSGFATRIADDIHVSDAVVPNYLGMTVNVENDLSAITASEKRLDHDYTQALAKLKP